jgi:hypothetical protein
VKGAKVKNYPSLKDHFRYAKTLARLTAGKKESIERMIVRQILSCRKHWPGRESIYKNVLFRRVVELDADFLRIVIEEIERVQEGSLEENPQAAAVVRGHFHLWDKTGEFPTANELFDYLKTKEPACRNWRRLNELNRTDPSLSYRKTMWFICRHYKLELKKDKLGRKPKLRK